MPTERAAGNGPASCAPRDRGGAACALGLKPRGAEDQEEPGLSEQQKG